MCPWYLTLPWHHHKYRQVLPKIVIFNIFLCFSQFFETELHDLFTLKMISSPYCADSGFVFIFVLNSLKRYTSVIAYMKCFSSPLRIVSFKNSRWAKTSVWNSVKVLLLVIICSARISGVNNEETGKFCPGIFIFASKHSSVCETHKHCRRRLRSTDWKSSLRP